MKAVVAAFNQEKALVGAFSVIVQPVVEPMELVQQRGLPALGSGESGGGVIAASRADYFYSRHLKYSALLRGQVEDSQ